METKWRSSWTGPRLKKKTLNVDRNHERGQKLTKEDLAKAVHLTETFDLSTQTFRKIINLDLSPKDIPNYIEHLY